MKKAFYSKVAGSLLLSAGLFASGVASAEALTFDAAGNAVFGMTHDTAGSFTDTFTFTVDPTAIEAWVTGTAVVGKTYIDGARLANYGITDITFFSDVGGVRTNLETTFTSDGHIEFYPVEGMTAGDYGFTVSGNTINGAAGGSYAGTLNVAAVPEPATYAMLGVGIGLLAFTARRKTNNKLG